MRNLIATLFIAATAQLACSGQLQAAVEEDLDTYLTGGSAAIHWAVPVVTVQQLQQDYAQNELAADRKYKAQGVVVSATVNRVFKTIGDKVALRTPTGVTLFLALGRDEWAADVKPGAAVSLACPRVRSVVAQVAAYDCVPRAVYVTATASSYIRQLPDLVRAGDPLAAKIVGKFGTVP